MVVRANIARMIKNCPIFSFSLLLMPFPYLKTALNSDFELLFTLTSIIYVYTTFRIGAQQFLIISD
jgi:hypothetical protein